jgi:hypothetical protein
MFSLLGFRSELKDTGGGIRYAKQRLARRRIIRFLRHHLSDDQRGALKATFDMTGGVADRPVHWGTNDGESCPVLVYLSYFLDEGAIRPLKYTAAGRFSYRFAPWFHRYLQKHPDIFDRSLT